MPNLPTDTKNQQTGRRATSAAINFLEKLGVIVRQEGQETDFGSDLELELHNGSSVTGSIVKCQVKGTAGLAFSNDGKFDVAIKSTTQNYWAALPVNVICILVDISDDAIYWQSPSASLVSAKYTKLRFLATKRADQDRERFLQTVQRLAETPTGSQILSQVAPCLNLFTAVSTQSTTLYDRGFETEPEVDASLRILYDHVERLCIYTGVEDHPATWAHWERRNAVIQTLFDSNDSGLLDGNVASEIVRYISGFYEVALIRISECVDSAQLIDSIPQLADLTMSGALGTSAVMDAFAAFRSNGSFRLEQSRLYTFGQSASERDFDFDLILREMKCNSYNLSGAQ